MNAGGGTALDLVVAGGAGHVGLPLSLAFARTGLNVGIFDISEDALAHVARGEMPFMERGGDELLREMLARGRLHFSSSPAMLSRTRQIIVVVGTPIDEFLSPTVTLFEQFVDQIAPHLVDGTLLILRSTVYPGTTAYVRESLRRHGRTIDVAFCPERIAEGYALEELTTLPELIGSDDPVAGDRAESLFHRLTPKTVRLKTKEAELAKLFTNAWRYMKFAIGNQFFMLAHDAGLNYTNILAAMKQDYPRAADLPGPGFAAGPCLFKDTMHLAAFTRDHFPLGHSAMQINEGLPAYVVSALERRYGTLAGKTVGILGMAFKAESDDPRASLSYKLRKQLSWSGARVLCADPYVKDARIRPVDEVVAESDILVLAAPHKVYEGLQIGGKDLVDVWGRLGGGIRL